MPTRLRRSRLYAAWSARRSAVRTGWPFFLAVALFGLYSATLLPGVGAGDTAEFQRVGPTLGLAHSTGYPLYSLLGWLWSHILPLGTPAWRMNLLSALLAALALGLLPTLAQRLGASAGAALLATVAFGLTLVLWQEATHAEIYALAVLLEVVWLSVLLAWRAERAPLWLVGLSSGMMATHHRTSVLLLPFGLAFVLLSRRPPLRAWLLACAAGLLPLALYAYVPWRAAPWQDGWATLRDYLSGAAGKGWFSLARLAQAGWRRPWDVFAALVWREWTPPGVLLALVGALWLWRRDRAAALLLSGAFVLVFGFCCAYFVPDLAPFLLAGQVIVALWLALGMTALLAQLRARWRMITQVALLLLPLWLLVWHWGPLRTANSGAAEQWARQALSAPLDAGALVLGDGYHIESLRYLQAVEGARPDLEYGFNVDGALIEAALSQGRSVYVLEPHPELGRQQQPVGVLWQVRAAPLMTDTPQQIDWADGIRLAGSSIMPQRSAPGDRVLLVLEWHALAQPQHDYVRFVHLVGPDGHVWGQADAPPAGGSTALWQPGQTVFDLAAPLLEAQAPPGQYTVVVGWYQYPPLQPLLVARSAQDQAQIGTLTVR